MSEAISLIDGVTDEDEDIIDLKKGRGLNFTSDNATDDTIVSDKLAETFRASLEKHRYLEAPRSAITEIVDAVSF